MFRKFIMVLFFDLEKLEAQSANDATKFIVMLRYHSNNKLATSNYSKIKPSKIPLHGKSFILNPEALFADRYTDIAFKVQYVKLAARRDWSLYRQYEYKHLNTSFFPDLNYDAIRLNPLLEITKNEIKFKYE